MPSDGCGADLSFAQCYGNSQWDPFFGGSYGWNDGWGHDPNPGGRVISGAEANHDERVQNTRDAVEANRALHQYLRSEGTDEEAMETYADLILSNPTLVLQARGFPRPPTGQEIVNHPAFQAVIRRANEVARSDQRRGYIEAGGWFLMDRKGNYSWVIKTPEARDESTRIWGLGEPEKYVRGVRTGRLVVIADFHTHVNKLSNPNEVWIANERGVPGIWIFPDGTAEAYGPTRGIYRVRKR